MQQYAQYPFVWRCVTVVWRTPQEQQAWRLQAHTYALYVLVLETYASPRGPGAAGASSGAWDVLEGWCGSTLVEALPALSRLDLHAPLLDQLLHLTQAGL